MGKDNATKITGTRPSRLAELRYGREPDRVDLVEACKDEVMRFLRVGKVPYDCARDALELALDEVLDALMVECPSWCEAPWYERGTAGRRRPD